MCMQPYANQFVIRASVERGIIFNCFTVMTSGPGAAFSSNERNAASTLEVEMSSSSTDNWTEDTRECVSCSVMFCLYSLLAISSNKKVLT